MRVLGRIRLSREAGEEGTSEARQREAVETWAKMHGHVVVGWAVDLGISGSVPPEQTPELGYWMRDRIPDFDILCAYRLDRFSRRVVPLNQLFAWCEEHGKSLASVSENIDLSHWVGRLVANVIAGVAEGELEAISERNRGSQQTLRKLGRWHGGTPPYGYRAVQHSDGWRLEIEPSEARTVQRIVSEVLAHHSTNSIAERLNQDAVPTRKGGPWSGHVIRQMLRNRALLGQATHNGKVVVDEEGLPLQRAEPLIPYSEWKQVQDALSSRSFSIRNSRKVSLLAGVAYCAECQAPLHRQSLSDRDYDYYRCGNKNNGCPSGSLRTDDLDQIATETLMDEIGDLERQERVYVQASDHTEELEQVESAIRRLKAESDAGLLDSPDEYISRLSKLTERRTALRALPERSSGFEWRGLGETYRQAWERMGIEERGRLLKDSGITVYASVVGRTKRPNEAGVFTFKLEIPEDIQSRVRR